MIKNTSKIKILNTFIMCFFVFAMFFNSIHDIFQTFNIDNIEVVDDFDPNESEKEVDEKIEFEDEFVKSVFAHHFGITQSEEQRFHKPAVEVSSINKRILIPPPRYS